MFEVFIISSWLIPLGIVWLSQSPIGEVIMKSINPKNIQNLMKSIFEALIAWFLGLFIPILGYIYAVVFFIVVDFLIGVIAAIVKGESFSFKKVSMILLKPVVFILLMGFMYQGQLMLSIPNVQLGDIEIGLPLLIAGFVWVMELKSIVRNIKKAFGYDIGKFLFDNIPMLKLFKFPPK